MHLPNSPLLGAAPFIAEFAVQRDCFRPRSAWHANWLQARAGTGLTLTRDALGFSLITTGGAPVTSVTGTSPIASSGGTTPAISLNDTAVTPATYNHATLTVDAKGRLTSASTGLTWDIVKKTADQSKASNASIADDSALVVAVSASKVYRIRFVFGMVCGATGGFRWRITGPASPTRVTYVQNYSSPSTAPTRIFNSAYDAADNTYGGDVGPVIFVIEILLANGTNAGNVTLSWAQQTSNGTNTTVLAGSTIEWMLLN